MARQGSKAGTRDQEMRGLLALRDSDGLTLRELSELCGVPQGTLSWWASELRRRDASPSPEFVEVVLEAKGGVGTDDCGRADDAGAASIEFTVTLRAGHRVAVPASYGLARLVRELEQC
jgi:transcriptional regulator with XRE-family HTH domain